MYILKNDLVCDSKMNLDAALEEKNTGQCSNR